MKRNKHMKEEKETEMEEKQPLEPELEQEANTEAEGEVEAEGEEAHEETPEEVIARLTEQIEKDKHDYLLLMADFENYRKRTLKEKAEIIKNGTERAMVDLLPVVDDFERALAAINNGGDIESLKQGVEIIYNSFIKYLESHQVKAMETNGAEFDADLHEAVTMFPAPTPDMKGKVVDTVLKGYTINDKVMRHAKVVVGQ